MAKSFFQPWCYNLSIEIAAKKTFYIAHNVGLHSGLLRAVMVVQSDCCREEGHQPAVAEGAEYPRVGHDVQQ